MKDLFDVICDLDDRAEDLTRLGYVDEAAAVRVLAQHLKGYVELRLTDRTPVSPDRT